MPPRRRARSVPAAALLAASAFAVGCGGERMHEEPTLPLTARLDRAALRVERPLSLPPEAGVRWVEEGYAGLAVRLDPGAAEIEEREGRRLVAWTLPLPAVEHAAGAGLDPLIQGLDLPRFVRGAEIDPDLRAAFWVEGANAGIVHHAGERLPEDLVLVYPVLAARLAGTALVAGAPAERLLAVKRLADDRAVECLAVPAGGRLTVRLPPLPEGRLDGAAAAHPLGGAPGEARELRLRIRLDGEELFDAWLPPGGEPVPFVGDDAGPLRLAGAPERRDLEIEVEGAPGDVVLLERVGFARRRSWAEGPNVLVLLVDTLRADRMGAYGSRRGLTPELDRLADDGLRFANAWSTSSWTLPAVGTILTSRHAAQHGGTRGDRRVGRGVRSLAEVLRSAGYRTAAFTDGGYVHPLFGVDRGFEVFDARGGGVEAVVERARAFFEEAGDGPWFALVHTYEVHAPYEPPLSAFRRVTRDRGDALLGRTPEPHAFQDFARRGERPPDELVEALEALYDEEVRHADRVLGGLLDELRRDGRYEKALVALLSDHGEEFGEHGALGHGDTLYLEQLHVPLVLKLPDGERAGRVVERPVSLLDFAPSVLDAVGLRDAARAAGFEGVSLLGGRAPSPIYAERETEETDVLRCMRKGRTVFVTGEYLFPAVRPRGPEAYDLVTDPRQRRNLVQPERRRQILSLLEELDRLTERFGATEAEATVASFGARAAARLGKNGY